MSRCDEARSRSSPSNVADQSAVAPEPRSHAFLHRSSEDTLRVRHLTRPVSEARGPSGEGRLGEGGERGPTAEDETLEE